MSLSKFKIFFIGSKKICLGGTCPLCPPTPKFTPAPMMDTLVRLIPNFSSKEVN